MPEHVLNRGIGAPSTCRSCGAKIVFAVMPVSGKSAPFEQDPDGAWILENGVARHVGKSGVQLELGETAPARWTSHFTTCPQAAEWRRGKDDR